ncbi:MAG: zeta toxin family protein [Lentisphaeria bacterium]|nr:zeta toxin family protein [Lentisphaeria bacterium]
MINHGIKRLELAALGDDFFQKVPEELPQGDLTDWYLRNFGRIINTDCAKMAFIKDGYVPSDPESVAKFYPQSSALVKELINRMFTGISSNDTVIFMAGGNGSGKSTFCDGIRAYLGSDWVIDATLASLDAARNTMEEVFASGANAVIIHIIRDPEDAWQNGVLKRAAHGSHCTPRRVFEHTHKVVADNVATLEREFARKGLLVYRIENRRDKK